MEITLEFATFCNICFNKNDLRKIEQTENLKRILMLFIENKILINEKEIYLCLKCCEKLESYDKFKEMCSRNLIDFRIEYFELKKKFEIMNDPNMEKKLKNFIETKIKGANDTLNFDTSKDSLNVEYNVTNTQKSDNNIQEKVDDYNYSLRNIKCKTEKVDYYDTEDYKLNTELDLDENEEKPVLSVPVEHMKIESYIEDFETNESSNENELMKQSTSTGPYEANKKSADLTTNPIQCEDQESVNTLKKNERLTGRKTSDLECNICKKTFGKPSSLTRHMRTHTGEKPFTCAICDKSFSDSNGLKRHVTVHTGERRYSCNKCGKRFAESGNLRRHELVHIGERTYTCRVCNKSFLDQIHLKVHKLVHTGEKPYQCSECFKRFADPTAYRTHMLTHT